jgi:hypothetical protein
MNHCCRACAKRQRAETAKINAMVAGWPDPRTQNKLFTGRFEDSWESDLAEHRLEKMTAKKQPLDW